MSESPGRPSAAAPASGARPSVIQLVFREKSALYAAYMPLLTDGGLFVPTTRDYRLGEDIYLLLTLPDDPQRYPVAGKVAWLTPANASGGRTQGSACASRATRRPAFSSSRSGDPGHVDLVVETDPDDLVAPALLCPQRHSHVR
jgi:type IV pilus assembly protein PilZ